MRLEALTSYLDAFLRIRDVPDWPGARNGLQVENSGQVTRLAAAVDASQATIDECISRECDLLLVHHGLFWSGAQPVTGRTFRRLRRLLAEDVAVYSAHLPLDAHPDVGNNAILARELGVEVETGFGEYRGFPVGLRGRLSLRREALAARLDEVLGGRIKMIPGGPERVETVAIVTGAAGDMIGEAAEAGLDAFITGEGPHHTYIDAMELGINVYYGGHYATEVWGVRALAQHLSERFSLEWEFLDFPTGL